MALAHDHLILLVDDDRSVVKLFTVYLTQAGYDVVVVERGEEALPAALMFRPAAIILDLLLPTQDGWDVLAELKACDVTQAIPVLIVSVLDRQPLGFHLGAEEHLVKPVERSRLLHALERTLLRNRFADRAPRVLLVHDDEGESERLESTLAREGYEVIAAHGGAEGLRLARRVQPDLALLDFLLSELDSFQVITALRGAAETARIPILLLTHRGIAGEAREITAPIRTIVMQGELSSPQLLQTVGHLLLEARP